MHARTKREFRIAIAALAGVGLLFWLFGRFCVETIAVIAILDRLQFRNRVAQSLVAVMGGGFALVVGGIALGMAIWLLVCWASELGPFRRMPSVARTKAMTKTP